MAKIGSDGPDIPTTDGQNTEGGPSRPTSDVHHFIARVEHDPGDWSASRLSMLTRIDDTTWDGVNRAVELLGQVYRGFNIHLRIAYDDLEEEIRIARTGLLATSGLDDTAKMRLINRALNMSVAVRLYQEHAMSEIHRKWGVRSEQADAAKRLFSTAFDRSFGYRVLHALRNALVHTAEQLITLSFSIWLDDPSKEDSTKSASVTLGISRLAFASTDVRAATRREVSGLTEDPDVLTLAAEALAEVELLNPALEPLLYPNIDDSVVLVWQTARAHFPTTSQAPTFVTLDTNANPISILRMPPVFWDYIVRRASAVERTRSTSSPAE